MLDRAIAIAREAHQGQVDKAGQPYINHPMRVMAACAGNPLAQMAAALHDVAEDCPAWPIERLAGEGFPVEVIEALALLCHDKAVPYMAYVEQIKGNPIARQVKLADLADNMDLGRLPNPGPKDYERVAKYQAAQELLLNNDDAWLADYKKELDAEREVEYTVTPEEGERLLARYPKDTPEGYKKIDPAEFFDGAL
jgi:hypothetical protein